MNLTDKMAYLRGMVDGMELDLTSTKEGKVLGQLLDVMQDLTAYVSDLQTQVDETDRGLRSVWIRIWAIWKILSMMRTMRMTHTIPVTTMTTLMMTILTTTMMRHSMRQSARPAIMSSL